MELHEHGQAGAIYGYNKLIMQWNVEPHSTNVIYTGDLMVLTTNPEFLLSVITIKEQRKNILTLLGFNPTTTM